jgi:imidazoleglycerol phosphate synthase glutamine amidotransferase subunit HisH
MVFSNKVYDKLKFLAQVVLPGLGTLYATVSGLYGWQNTEEVVGTIMAVDFFLGALLGLSNKQFMDEDRNFAGDLHVVNTEDEGVQTMLAFNPESSPESLADQKTVTMKVVKH